MKNYFFKFLVLIFLLSPTQVDANKDGELNDLETGNCTLVKKINNAEDVEPEAMCSIIQREIVTNFNEDPLCFEASYYAFNMLELLAMEVMPVPIGLAFKIAKWLPNVAAIASIKKNWFECDVPDRLFIRASRGLIFFLATVVGVFSDINYIVGEEEPKLTMLKHYAAFSFCLLTLGLSAYCDWIFFERHADKDTPNDAETCFQ